MNKQLLLWIIVAVVSVALFGFFLSSILTRYGVNPTTPEQVNNELVAQSPSESSDYTEVDYDALRLEDRFANLMESLSDNHTMRYDVDIEAILHEADDSPDSVKVTLHLREGQSVK